MLEIEEPVRKRAMRTHVPGLLDVLEEHVATRADETTYPAPQSVLQPTLPQPLRCLGRRKVPAMVLNLPCAQARMARTVREHEAPAGRNMVSNHTCSDRPLPTWKSSIVVTAIIFTLFKTNIKDHLFCSGGRRPPPLYIGFE